MSLLIIVVLTVGAVLVAIRLAAQVHEHAFAEETADLLRAPIDNAMAGATLTGPLPDDQRTRADIVIWPLLSDTVRGVRVRTPDGTFLYGAGAAPAEALPNDPEDVVSHRGRSIDGTPTFFTTIAADGYTIDVAQNPSTLDAAIRRSRTERIALIAILAGAAWLFFQGAFWISVRTLGLAHGRLTYLYDTGQELRSSLDLNDVLTRVARDVTALAHARYGLVALYDDPSTELVLRAAYDRRTDSVTLLQRAIDDWFMRRCVATNATVTDAQAGASYYQYFGVQAGPERSEPVLCVPMSLAGRIVGAVAVIRAGDNHASAFSPTETKLVEELAAQASTAVEQAMLFAKVRGDANEIESSYDSTLKALMAALDAKDEGTEGHCERVARLTVQLAKTMNVPNDQLIHIERGALLHDVGKIGVPDGILKKPRALNDNEWEAMRKHPLLAGLMVSKVGFLEPALPILLYHHERYDGSGYPFGLSHDNIPLEARIFSVVDAYDAMTSERPYRGAMTHREAMDEVRANSELQFDPDVVTAFEGLMATRPDLRVNAGHRTILHTHDEDLDPSRHDDSVA